MTADGFKQALSDACSSIAGCLKQLNEESKLAAENRRKQEERFLEMQERLSYQQEFSILLDRGQSMNVVAQMENFPYCNTTQLLLTQQQVNAIVATFIQQAIYHGDSATMQHLREVLFPGGLEFNLSYLRYLHKRLFDDFLSKIDNTRSYATCIPAAGVFFVIAADGFGLCYNISTTKMVYQKQYLNAFHTYMVTASAKDLFRQFGLNFNKLQYNANLKHLIIYFK